MQRARFQILVATGLASVSVGGIALTFGSSDASSAVIDANASAERLTTVVTEHVHNLLSEPREHHLRVPSHEALRVAASPYTPAAVAPGARSAQAYQFVSRVFARPSSDPYAIGYVRRGVLLAAGERVPGPGCRGTWYTVERGGVICSTDGFLVSTKPQPPIEQPKSDVTRALPFRYAKVVAADALRFYRVPTAAEEAEITRARDAGERLPDVVEQSLKGVYLLAFDKHARADARGYLRTVRGRYVREQDIEIKPEPVMRGVLLNDKKTLPYAFVYGKHDGPTALYRVDKTVGVTTAGIADNHARIPALDEVTIDGRAFVVGPNQLGLPRVDTRIARQRKRPADIPIGTKWIHVDLTEQTLVAYEGDRPVFATLVSTGKGEDYATPTGLFRVREKHISTTMSGPDPDAGVYEVEEVPWTLYYQDSYALHGAYWHDEFGRRRSHGCTNISPIDARWLFYWSNGRVPAGWNGLRHIKGTYVYVTLDDDA